MLKSCIVNVAVREPYTILQKRLLDSLKLYNQDYDIIYWTDEYPAGSNTLFETYYGFKVWAIQEAINREYTNIMWLDSACYAIQSPKVFLDIIEKQGYYFTGNEDILSRNISDYYLDEHNLVREDLTKVPLPSGSIYGFNIETEIGRQLFEQLKEDERKGFFMNCYKDDSARIDGKKIIDRPTDSKNLNCNIVDSHRHDEATLAYLIWKNNLKIDLSSGGTHYFQGTVIRADKNIGKVDLVIVDEHTFDKSLLHKTSKVLDCGARGFGFSKWITENIKCPVTAIDADPLIQDPNLPNVTYINAAISNRTRGTLRYFKFGNGSGSYTDDIYEKPSECQEFNVIPYNIKPFWDLIKMDVEGAEYQVLMNMQEPLAKQISVEFHEHTPAKKGEDYMNELFMHMSKWYIIYNNVREERHGCGKNYWDVLFILK